jgi:hypothetical protein
MRIVFFTSLDALEGELFRYMFARVADRFDDVHIVAVQPSPNGVSSWATFRRKIKRLGVFPALEVITGYPAQRLFAKLDRDELERLLGNLPRPHCNLTSLPIAVVSTVNGDDAVDAMNELNPDVIIQAGAGILKRRIFSCARIGTLNMHHGIAPLIRGMNSIYWALWEREPSWIGATIHLIDDGIDTGAVLAYAPIRQRSKREGFPSLFSRATEDGVTQLLAVLERLVDGDVWRVPVPVGRQVYRSTFSGWKMTWIAIRSRLLGGF